MAEESDLLALWVHYESRGYDDKNRMLTSSALLLGASGGLFGAAVTCLTASSTQTLAAIVLASLSLASAFLSMLLVGFFAAHAERNFRSAEYIREPEPTSAGRLAQRVGEVLCKVDAVRTKPSQVRLPGSGPWLSKMSSGAAVGRIFFVFSAISGVLIAPPVLLLAYVVICALKRGTCA